MRIAIGAVLLVAALWATQFSLRVAPLSVDGAPPAPAALAAFAEDPPIDSVEDWMARRVPALRTAFEAVYGAAPSQAETRIVARHLIDAEAFGGLGRIEELSLRVSASGQTLPLRLVIVTPNSADAPAPVVVIPNFCGNPAAFGNRYPAMAAPTWLAPRCRNAASRSFVRALHGANIVRPPFRDLLADGYAVATFSPAEIAPDDPASAAPVLQRLSGDIGAIGAWAWSIVRVVDVLEREPAVDRERIALFGHSRFGKAALWAAAMDQRIGLVIANQSGRLGASAQSRTGEQLSDLFRRFPHWFPASARGAVTGDLDQHLLLALIAPRPILIGGARLDRWSDPAGAFRAAQAATPVYRLFGGAGLTQQTLSEPDFDADIAFFLRDGGHGVRPYDWRMARSFLAAHFGGES
ncbi:MAG: hypothetical protein K2X34_11955 [Hyphomonadaceae bacterium]|nr:hypothetical protein [Hyphomonadaceae bacterium]